MWLLSVVTYLHFISIFFLFSALIFELSIVKRKMIRSDFVMLKKADLFFGICAILTVVTGLFKMYYFEKGENYYLLNPIFILKFSLFILVGLLSTYPTLQFLQSQKLKLDFIELKCFRGIRFLLILKLVLLLVIPFLAICVANGINI